MKSDIKRNSKSTKSSKSTASSDGRLRNPVSLAFCAYLKELREGANISASGLALRLKIHRNSQLNYEKNRDTNIEYLLAFSDALKISFWHLIRQRIKLSRSPKHMVAQALDDLGPFHHSVNKPKGQYQVTHPVQSETQYQHMSSEPISLFQGILEQYRYQSGIEVFTQKGTSMQPKISDGDSLIVDTQDTELIDGNIYFLELNQELVARRIQIGPKNDIIIASDNQQFAPLHLTFDERDTVNIIGKMLYYIGTKH